MYGTGSDIVLRSVTEIRCEQQSQVNHSVMPSIVAMVRNLALALARKSLELGSRAASEASEWTSE